MARSQLRFTCETRSGDVVQNAKVYVYETGTTTVVADLFTAKTGGSAVAAGTLTSDAQGDIIGWLTTPRQVDVYVTDNSNTAYYPASGASAVLTFEPFTETVQVYSAPENISDSTSSTSSIIAASQTAVKAAYDRGTTAINRSVGIVANVVTGYGAAGNGTTDDTAAIQAAADACASPDGITWPRDSWGASLGGPQQAGVVYLPAGHYKVTSTINLPRGVSVVGEEKLTTFVEPTMLDTTLFKGPAYNVNCTFSDMTLTGKDDSLVQGQDTYPTSANHFAVGINPGSRAREVRIERVTLTGFSTSIDMLEVDGIYLDAVRTEEPADVGLRLEACRNLVAFRCIFTNAGNGGHPTWAGRSNLSIRDITDDYGPCQNLEFRRCYFDEAGDGDAPIIIDGGENITFDGGYGMLTAGEWANHAGRMWSHAPDPCMVLRASRRVLVRNTYIQCFGGTANPTPALVTIGTASYDASFLDATFDLTNYSGGGTASAALSDSGVRTVAPR